MTDAATLRDSTQIVLSGPEIADHLPAIESEFTVTIVVDEGTHRIIGSPIEIKRVSEYLARRRVALP